MLSKLNLSGCVIRSWFLSHGGGRNYSMSSTSWFFMIFQETVWVGMESCDSRKETVGKKITWGIHAISWVYRCICRIPQPPNHQEPRADDWWYCCSLHRGRLCQVRDLLTWALGPRPTCHLCFLLEGGSSWFTAEVHDKNIQKYEIWYKHSQGIFTSVCRFMIWISSMSTIFPCKIDGINSMQNVYGNLHVTEWHFF